jgi:hypothetical protein
MPAPKKAGVTGEQDKKTKDNVPQEIRTFYNPTIVLQPDHAGEPESVKSPADMPVVDLTLS